MFNRKSNYRSVPLPPSPLYSTQVGDNLFVHAGLLPEHVRESGGGGRGEGEVAAGKEEESDIVAKAEGVMESLNAAACSWMLGEIPIPQSMWDPESPLWTRVYSNPDSEDIDAAARARLEEVRVTLFIEKYCFSIVAVS